MKDNFIEFIHFLFRWVMARHGVAALRAVRSRAAPSPINAKEHK